MAFTFRKPPTRPAFRWWGFALLVSLGSGRPFADPVDAPVLAPCYGDNMVLKAPVAAEPNKVILWGWVPAGQRVSVELPPPAKPIAVREYDRDESLRADPRGWQIWTLLARDLRDPLPREGPFSLTVRRLKAKATIAEQPCTNVVWGQVWALWIRRPPGTFHARAELPPQFRVLRATTFGWGVRSYALMQQAGVASGWRIPATDALARESLPDLLAYAVPELLPARGSSAGAFGVILVQSEATLGGGLVVRENAGPLAHQMEQALLNARGRCDTDYAQALQNLLQAKRRGLPTQESPKLPSVPCLRAPTEKGEFMCDVLGVWW